MYNYMIFSFYSNLRNNMLFSKSIVFFKPLADIEYNIYKKSKKKFEKQN